MKKNCTPHVCKWIINQFFNWVTDEPHYTTKVKNIKRLCWKNSLTVRLIYHSTYQKVTKRKHFFIFLWILFNLEKCSGIDHQTFFCNSSGNTVFSTKILTHKMWRRATAAKKKVFFRIFHDLPSPAARIFQWRGGIMKTTIARGHTHSVDGECGQWV